ncbi:D-alanyl-D-alanine carboxypeptidase [Lactobacillus sp. DCY120]|uniref:D-alanyl-D-alanine carboxypeptidase n=1 Tax=Bombilactobacillus apium TaxID=2675299 RepID=A0A850R732_9LACO|nr:serine hydrolase [Bombilactobacillus apium]NVY96647.1 D-alanyl-D-alanine carboxypeptidase [Bombilactobacillus apium]
MRKQILRGGISALLLILGFQVSLFTSQAAVVHPQVAARAAVLVDLQTGQVVASQNDRQRLPIASLAKLVVIYLTEEAIAQQKLARQKAVSIPPALVQFSQDQTIANVPLNSNQKYTIEQLEQAALLASSNSAAMVLAQLVSGSQTAYCQQAEKLLAAWGIKQAHFYSASGLENGALKNFKNQQVPSQAQTELSAREIALVARKLVRRFPQILNLTSQRQALFPQAGTTGQKIVNTNELLTNTQYHFQGLKTGTTSNQGQNFIGYTTLKNRPVLTVVLNTPDKQTFAATLQLLRQTDRQTQVLAVPAVKQAKILRAKTLNSQVALRRKVVPEVFASPEQTVTLVGTLQTRSAPLAREAVAATQKLVFRQTELNDYLDLRPTVRYYPQKDIARLSFWDSCWQKISSLWRRN